MRSRQGFGSVGHLIGRFFGSILPVGPSKSAQGWAISFLLPGEVTLFEASSGPDRRHAIGVARRAIGLLSNSGDKPGNTATRPFVAAALLHDVGKSEARLGTLGRVVATAAAVALRREKVLAWGHNRSGEGAVRGTRAEDHTTARPPDDAQLPRPSRWSIREWQARMGRYLMHDSIGARMLEEAGSDLLTVRWAREHHLPESQWSVEPRIGHVLKEADGD
jgi:hypothetical protein